MMNRKKNNSLFFKKKIGKNGKEFSDNIFWTPISIRIQSMTITAMMLALYIIFAYVGNQFIHLTFLSSFLNLDISLIFLIPLVFIVTWEWWLFAAIVGGLANFIWAGVGGWIGAIYNVVLNVVLLSFLFLLKFFFFKKNYNYKNSIKSKKKFLWILKGLECKVFSLCLISFIYIILINCLLNGLIFTPLYFLYFNVFSSAWFIDAMREYNADPSKHVWLLGIPDYWTGIFALYSAFNAIKFGIVFTIVFPILVLKYRTNIADGFWR